MAALLARRAAVPLRLLRLQRSFRRAAASASASVEQPAGGEGATVSHLRELRIKDFALVEEQTVSFTCGLNVITGASGSGKSVMMDAISQLCGAPVLEDHVRPPSTCAVLEAEFLLGAEHSRAVAALLQGAEAAPAEAACTTLRLQRELHESPGGTRSVCRANGRVVPLRTLRALGGLLVDVNGQGSAAGLEEPAPLLALLDALGGSAELAARFGASLVWARSARAEAARLRASLPSSEEEAEELRALAAEVADARLEAGEEGRLRARLRALEAGGAAAEAALLAEQALSGGAAEALAAARRELRALTLRLAAAARAGGEEAEEAEEGPLEEAAAEAEAALERCSEAEAALEAAAGAAAAAARALRAPPGEREAAAARLKALERLCRRHGVRGCDALLAAAARAAEALGGAGGAAARLATLDASAARAEADGAAAGLELSGLRRAAARALCAEAERGMAALGMEGARLRCALEWEEAAGDGSLAVPGAAALGLDEAQRYAPAAGGAGFDAPRLLLAASPGEPLRALGHSASGGERARVMLALKLATARAAAAQPALSLFDEVDSGVGGGVGARVGAALLRLATQPPRQVLCVTHLPQVAAFGTTHLAVSKALGGEGEAARHRTRCELLATAEAREAELAAMLGLQRSAGRELLEAAQREAAQPQLAQR